MANKKSRDIFRLSFFLSVLLLFQMGCTVGKTGRPDVNGFDWNSTSGLKGQNKQALIQTFGSPDSVVYDGETEYWMYRNDSGWNVGLPYFYSLIGATRSRDLVMKFQDEKVTDTYSIENGRSIGILRKPLDVAN